MIEMTAVIGAGTMGAGIAQKIATEGFSVVLLDIDDERVSKGLDAIRISLEEGVQRRIFSPDQAQRILLRISGTSDWRALADVDLAVEAVFEDLGIKSEVLVKLESVCRSDTIIGTNTSSFSVSELAVGMAHPERLLGLHYFYHPAKNRLVEIVSGDKTDSRSLAEAWSFQEQIGKTAIASEDACGFIVNRFFVPWLNEAVRILEEEQADSPTIEAAARSSFGIGMGPFELMNVTGVPIAMHSAETLGRAFGPFYAPAKKLVQQVESGSQWDLNGEPDASRYDVVRERLFGTVFYVAAQLVAEGVGSMEDSDLGARVGLRWPLGPFELANEVGVEDAAQMAKRVADRWGLELPTVLAAQSASGQRFGLRVVRTNIDDGIATLTVYRPDAMNALNEAVIDQLNEAFGNVATNDAVRGIVIAGSGKAFVAGADIRFFVDNIEKNDLDRIIEFSRRGQELLMRIDECEKPVVARMEGLALGGGLELALACDYIVASERAAMAFPETGIGIIPGFGGTQRTTRRVGKGLAKYLVLAGITLRAAEAAEIGLIDRVVSHNKLDEAVREALRKGVVVDRTIADVPARYRVAADYFEHATSDVLAVNNNATPADDLLADALGRISGKAPVAVRASNELIDDGACVPLREGLRMEIDRVAQIFATRDAYEGLKSVGRSKPKFEGR